MGLGTIIAQAPGGSGGIALSDVAAALPQVSLYTGAPSAVVTSGGLAKTMVATAMPAFAKPARLPGNVVNFRKDHLHQQFNGVGAALTAEAAWAIMTLLSQAQRTVFLTDIFVTKGFNILRVPFGSTDFNPQGTSLGDLVYTYADNGGTADPNLNTFSIARDTNFIIPCLLEILALKPSLRIMSDVCVVPAWLQSNHQFVGNAANYTTWANYFVKSIQAYAAYGIPISYVIPQNEPEFGTSVVQCIFTPAMMATFIGTYLRPALDAAGLTTEIWGGSCELSDAVFAPYGNPPTQTPNGSGWDARILYDDALAGPACAAMAFHPYDGNTPAPFCAVGKQYARRYPTKPWYMTEFVFATNSGQAFSATAMVCDKIIPLLRNDCSGVIWWNLALPAAPGFVPGSGTSGGAPNSGRATGNRPLAYIANDFSGVVTYLYEYWALTHLSSAAAGSTAHRLQFGRRRQQLNHDPGGRFSEPGWKLHRPGLQQHRRNPGRLPSRRRVGADQSAISGEQ